MLVLTVIIGAIVGLVVVAFILLTENLGSRLYPAGGSAWRRVLVPVLGALTTGFLLFRYFPDARGSGIPQTKTALFIHQGYISLRTVLGKFGLCSASLASGIALGREGPSVQVGAGLASVLGRRLGLSDDNVKALLPVGASAALAAAFNTPIAAVLFSLEEVMGDMHAPVLGSIVLSSATSWMVLHLLLGDEPLFHVPAYQLVHPAEFGVYAVLGVVGGLVSAGFVKLLLWQRRHFLSLPRATAWAYPAVGGLTVGLLGWFAPDVLGVGYGAVGKALNGQLVIGTMALLVALKLVATATCYASGNAGGIFGPSLFIGAMMGGAVGGAAHWLMPDYSGSVGAYALVGMGVAFAGIVRVPLTSVIMIFEMTRDYSIIVPLMIANLVSYVISSRLQEEPIYEALQHQDGIHLPGGARTRERLLTVGDGYRKSIATLTATESVRLAASQIDGTRDWWPVLDENGLRGMVAAARIQAALEEGQGDQLLSVLVPAPGPRAGLHAGNFPHLHTDHPLDRAMQVFARTGLTVLPVVSRTNVRDLMGVISRQEVIDAYAIDPTFRRPAAGEPVVSKRSFNLMVRTVAAFATVAVLATILTYYYRSERADRGRASYRAGEALMAQGRALEAAEQFRSALSISHSVADRLALGLALVEAGRQSEAGDYLRDVLQVNPHSGPANLGLARVVASEGSEAEAAVLYRRAADGVWPKEEQENRLKARLALVESLNHTGKRSTAQAELLLIVAEAPKDTTIRKDLANRLVAFNLQREATVLLRDVVQREPNDGDAWAALGQAEFALGDFAAAREPFQKAVEFGAADKVTREAAIAERILDLNPMLPGLNSRERYSRSMRVMQGVLDSLDACVTDGKGFPSDLEMDVRRTRTALSRRGRPASFSDAVDSNIDLAQTLWTQRARVCTPDSPPDIGVTLLMSTLRKN
ncbi:MAG: chloride channel protein [Candidatus Solibacter sp.]